jgi:hypothetical protein
MAVALYKQLQKAGCLRDANPAQLTQHYQKLAAADESLRVNSPEGQQAIGALGLLARRSPAQVEAAIREVGAAGKGFDPELIALIAQRVYQRLSEGRE